MTTREKGTGLGLAIVAKIIEQHGGIVELVDAEPDPTGRVGACVTFTLPLDAKSSKPVSQEPKLPASPYESKEEPLYQAAVHK
jgi:two-component system nitrogen regulation sensor histidine kinase NtrY